MSVTSLKPRQVQALHLLAVGRPASEVAAVVNVSAMTIFRWKQSPAFRSRLERVSNSGLEEIAKKLQALSLTAVETLQESLCDMSLPVHLRAKVALGVLGSLGSVNAVLTKRLPDGAGDFELEHRFKGPALSYDSQGERIFRVASVNAIGPVEV